MEASGFPPLTFAVHDKATIPAGLVRKILVRDVALQKARRGSRSDLEDLMDIVRVIYHQESDDWWAESPDVDGRSAAADTTSRL